MSAPERTRPSLTRHFFPELTRITNAEDVRDAIALNTRACEVILLDLLGRHDSAFEEEGPGCLVLNAKADVAGYVTAELLRDDLETATRLGDSEVKQFLETVIARIEANSNREKVLMLLLDNSSQRLIELGRDFPASGIEDMQYTLAAAAGTGAALGHARFHSNKPKGFG